MNYEQFLYQKRQVHPDSGFDPLWIPDTLFDFQKYLVEWAIRKGRAAIFADCGMGKTPMQLVWAENVIRHTNKPVLILTPLAVAPQTCREGDKFHVDTVHSRDGHHDKRITVTNYQRLHYFDPADFGGVVCDESSILKNFDGATRAAVTEFMREIPYRLLCTATAAPNDYHELGTSSEALGYLGYKDMLTRFFKQHQDNYEYHWSAYHKGKYRFRGHAEEPFWRWVCSWSRACRRPSDLGFEDGGFILPELCERELVIEVNIPRQGMLLSVPARGLREQREERRITLKQRCDLAAETACLHRLDEPDNPSSVIWCHLNPEGDMLAKLLPDAAQVKGSQDDEEKEELLLAFQRGEVPILITKPKIGCWGLNWQHCNNVITFPSHSWEQYYQAVRRCWRFGQQQPVTVTVISSEGEANVLNNLQRKAHQAERMFRSLVQHVTDEMHIDRTMIHTKEMELPTWL